MPKPKSDSMKRFTGTYRASRSTGELCVAPPVDPTKLRCPAGLSPAGRKVWKTLSRELVELGTLAAVDVPLLETACRAYARAMQAEALVDRDGPIVKTADGGMKEHPAVRQARQWWQVFEKVCGRLGIGATSRSSVRVVSSPEKDGGDEWAKIDGYLGPRKVG